jgi:site-specific recombinase XerD
MAIIKKKTSKGETRYTAVLWHQNRALKSKTFERKGDADGWLKRQEIAIDNGEVGRLKGKDVTLTEFFEQVYWPNRKVTDGTSVDYRRLFKQHIEPRFGSCKLSNISEQSASDFLSKLVANGMSANRANKAHTVFSTLFKMALKFHYVGSNPLNSVEWFKDNEGKTDFWSREESQQFLNWAFLNKTDRFALYQFAYESGMRISEIIALQRDCINLQDGLITVRRNWCRITNKLLETTKTKKIRYLPMSVSLKSTLQKVLQSHDSHYVFCRKDGNPLIYKQVRLNFNKDQSAAGMNRRIAIHTIRHTFASHFVMNGGSIYDLMKLLGHSNYETTARYAHLAMDHVRSQAGRVSFVAPLAPNTFPIIEDSTRPHLTLIHSVS